MTTLSRPSLFCTERCTVVSTRARAGGGCRETSTFGTFPVTRSGVGGEAVRGRGEEGPPQRGVSLPPLHGVHPGGGVQEDAAGKKQSANGPRLGVETRSD